MKQPRDLNPVELLIGGEDPEKILKFLQRWSEEMTVAFADAVAVVPDVSRPSGKLARGSVRRDLLETALRKAGYASEANVQTKWTTPRTWSYPIVQIGAFKLALGVVYSHRVGRERRLRTVSKYIAELCARNAPLNRQFSMLLETPETVSRVIPPGTFGGLLVTEYNAYNPDVPAFCGFWVPSETLKMVYYSCSLASLMTSLRSIIEEQRKPHRKQLERKMPKLRKKTGSEE